jgi:ubiquinone/menaquinone biosynthesis C-methylase UbiE
MDKYCEEERRAIKDLENVNFENKYVLDLGCGCGGKTVYFAQCRSKFVVGLDINKTGLSEGILCAKNNKVREKVDFVVGDALHLPFGETAFEMVVANHVVEHIPQVFETLKQCMRVMKQKGFLYTTFPSWFYPYAGHLWHLIAVPWCHFLFSGKTLMNVVSLSMAPSAYHTIWQFNNLSKITIRRFRKIVKSLDFETVFCEEKPPLKSLSILRFRPLFIKEFFVSDATYILRKRNAI